MISPERMQLMINKLTQVAGQVDDALNAMALQYAQSRGQRRLTLGAGEVAEHDQRVAMARQMMVSMDLDPSDPATLRAILFGMACQRERQPIAPTLAVLRASQLDA